MTITLLKKYLLYVSACVLATSAFAQVNKMPRLTTPIEFDGIVGQEEWSEIPVLPIQQFNPNNGADIIENSEVFMAYDDTYLYLAGRLYHENMNDIMAQSYKRDVFTYASDYFGIIVDQFNDNENAVGFATTPMGGQGGLDSI